MGYAYALIYGAAAIAGFSAFAGVVRAYFARVAADGGTTVDKQHAQEIYDDTNPYDPTLIQSCDSGKATVLYSMIPSQSLLLYQYTGAAAAYSLRSLSAGTINVVKVRRSGDDAELDFTATEVSDGTLAAWVTAGGGTEDGFVTTWYDQSGNTNNATQATAANQPKIVSSGSLITDNGKAAIDFDGTNDSLGAGSVDVSTMTIAVVASYTTTGTHRNFAVKGAVVDDKDTFAQAADFTLRYDGAFSAGTLTPSINTQYLRFSKRSTSAQTDYVNSAINVNDSQVLPNIEGTYNIGNAQVSTEHFNGKVQEAIAWEFDQSANRTGIEANINDYYNIYS